MDMHEYHLGFLNEAVQLSVEKQIDVETALEMLLQQNQSPESNLTENYISTKKDRDIDNDFSGSQLEKHLAKLNAVFSVILLSNWF
ncbi:hypothetical protein [Crocosphaera chwakensis]|uniref:Uncharacterized protein n=1 Tax=Crocosphaera chwakensis CCY0110 TaxID=391612 RepID=A3IML2_9CHRO|nr:hypothetical protein [Crocosphaera chwakensis]EAZ92381.1 hypothetical protein CY0110_28519 [Crocosphaera chwakensis CCY0110]